MSYGGDVASCGDGLAPNPECRLQDNADRHQHTRESLGGSSDFDPAEPVLPALDPKRGAVDPSRLFADGVKQQRAAGDTFQVFAREGDPAGYAGRLAGCQLEPRSP